MKAYPAPLLKMLAAATIAVCSNQLAVAANPSVAPKPAELSSVDSARLDRQRALIAESVKRRYHVQSLTRTAADLPVLQRLLDDQVFSKSQTYKLRSLGVVFGDVLAT